MRRGKRRCTSRVDNMNIKILRQVKHSLFKSRQNFAIYDPRSGLDPNLPWEEPRRILFRILFRPLPPPTEKKAERLSSAATLQNCVSYRALPRSKEVLSLLLSSLPALANSLQKLCNQSDIPTLHSSLQFVSARHAKTGGNSNKAHLLASLLGRMKNNGRHANLVHFSGPSTWRGGKEELLEENKNKTKVELPKKGRKRGLFFSGLMEVEWGGEMKASQDY